MLELTTRCNVRCRHCYVCSESSPDELTLREWENILDQLAEAGTLMLTLTGGEPFTRPDLLDIVSHARRREFSVVLYTNGTLLGEAEADRLAALHLHRVEISLLGSCAETHDGITRVPGSFDRALNAARLLVQRNVQVQLKTTWMRANADEEEAMHSVAAEVGASFRNSFLLLHCRDGCTDPVTLAPADEQLRAMALRRLTALPEGQAPAPIPQLSEEEKRDSSPCGVGKTSVRIDARGTVYPCATIDTALGDLRSERFLDIWQDNPDLAALRAIRVSDLETCRDCPLLLQCRRCLGLTRMETGSLTAASPQSCRVAKAFETCREERRCEFQ